MDGPNDTAPTEDRMRTSGFAIASLVFSLAICCFGINGIVSVILGIFALRQIRSKPQIYSGTGLAHAGIILGLLNILFIVGFFTFMTNRYFEVKPVAEQAISHISEGKLDQATQYFSSGLRNRPEVFSELQKIHEYFKPYGKFVELNHNWSIEVESGLTTVRFKACFQGGDITILCRFRKEDEKWRLQGLHVAGDARTGDAP